MGHIYKITNPTGRVYVGKTERKIRQRIADHKCDGKKGENRILARSINKYGWDAHKFEIIEEVDDLLLDEREIFWITELKTYCYENELGMNMTKGGDGQRSTWIHDLERREKQGKRFSGEGNPFYGKTHSGEFKERHSKTMSEINKRIGRVVPEWGANKGQEMCKSPIVVYDINGIKKGVFGSITECAKFLNVTRPALSTALTRNTHCGGKYFFRYADGEILDKIEVPTKIKYNKKRPVVAMVKGVKKRYECADDAAKELGIPKTTINRAAYYNNGKPIRTGHIFYYE